MFVVAVHGYPLDHRLYDPLTALAEAGHLGPHVQVLAPDLRGRGRSPHPAEPVHTMDLFARDLAKDIQAAVPASEPFVLMGLSMGGYIVLEFLASQGAAFRGRIVGVCLSGSKASADDENGKRGREEAAKAIEREGMDTVVRSMMPKLLPASRQGSNEAEVTRRMILDTPPATAIADLRGMALRKDHFVTLEALRVPFLVIAGEADSIIPQTELEAMTEAAAYAPYLRLLTLPDVSHLAPLEAPEEVAKAVAELIVKGRGLV
jgi:pimeloyl-ACP methyl ester carboxylesterase